MIKYYIATQLAMMLCVTVNISNILIETESALTNGKIAVNFYYNGAQYHYIGRVNMLETGDVSAGLFY